MEHKIIPLTLLDGHTRNYRQHPESQVAQLTKSLDRFSQVRSIVVRPTPYGRYTILAGHGVVLAAQQKQYEALACDIVPAEWDDITCEAYLLADNLHAQNSTDEEQLLAELLQEQVNAGFDLESLGSDDESLRDMLESLGDAYLGSDEDNQGKPNVQFKEFDESIADDLDTELCQQCGKLCVKSGKGKK